MAHYTTINSPSHPLVHRLICPPSPPRRSEAHRPHGGFGDRVSNDFALGRRASGTWDGRGDAEVCSQWK